MTSRTRNPGGWRAPILAQFSPEIAAVARLTIVADPDELLAEPGVVEGIRKQNFEIIPFDDHVAFRYAYEQRFRQVWDTGAITNLVVILRASRSDLNGLPFDLLEQAKHDGRLLSFSLGELFPHLAPHVLAELDRADLDAVHAAQQLYQQGDLGENASRDFLLRNVFRIDPAQILDEVDLLRVLLRHHYAAKVLPPSFADRLVHLLRVSPRFKDWPLESIVPNRAQFFDFLQERWPIFLERHQDDGPDRLHEEACRYGAENSRPVAAPGLRQPGPADLPFDHDDIRVYIGDLFTDGLLIPTSTLSRSTVQGTWMAAGVAGTSDDQTERLRKLLQLHQDNELDDNAHHQEWIQTAVRWAEIVAVRWAVSGVLEASDAQRFNSARDRIQVKFQSWLASHYASLHSLSFLPRPVMVHQVPRYLAHRVAANPSESKFAVLVVDGLAMDQWAALRQQTQDCRSWVADESGVFAWIPTLTSVSRQSIFAGDPPFFQAASLDTTGKEEQHWRRLWEDQGLRKDAVAYIRQGAQEIDETFITRVQEIIDRPRCSIVGIVMGTIDQMLHGAVTGTDGFHASIRHWRERGALRNLIDVLLDRGFEVVLTADHGNVEGIGMGRPNVGVVAEERGERVHVFRDSNLRSQIGASYPGSIEWPTVGLPENYLALIAPAWRAFITEGRRTVAHGGTCLEEVIVPFVTIARRS
jgi:hypothetical protein